MELIRDYRAYPWRGIAAGLCLAAPLLASLCFYPDWQGPRANASIAIWMDVTLRMAALSLSFYRALVTWRGGRPFENTFQMIALGASGLFESSSVYPAADTGMPGWDLLLVADPGGVVVSVVAIVGSLAFIAFGWRRRSGRSG